MVGGKESAAGRAPSTEDELDSAEVDRVWMGGGGVLGRVSDGRCICPDESVDAFANSCSRSPRDAARTSSMEHSVTI